MQKNVKFLFTLSTLSAIKCNLMMLSEPPCRFGYNKTAVFLVLRVKVLKMKTYTLTWTRPNSWRKNGVCRERFERGSFHWNYGFRRHELSIAAFAAVLTWFENYDRHILVDHFFRLSSCGKLVARQATYQGV